MEDLFEECGRAASVEEVFHQELARWFEVDDDGNFFGEFFPFAEREVDASTSSDGGEMDDGVGRATECEEG